jgi:uncharacterized membrane protein
MAVSPELASATPILVLHIAGGAVAMVAGAGAMAFRKGSQWHARAGRTFVAGMAVMAVFGAVLGLLGPMKLAAAAGGLAVYLVLTAWLAVKRKDRGIGTAEVGAFLVGLGLAATFLVLGLVAQRQPDGMLGEQAAYRYFICLGLTSLPVIMDMTVLLRRGIAGVQRIARHLWRMCLAMFIAVSTFFPQQPDIFVGVPAALLAVPSLTVLAFMLYWLVRLPFTQRFRHAPAVLAPGGRS